MLRGEQASMLGEDVVASIKSELISSLSTTLPEIHREVLRGIMRTELTKILVDVKEEMIRLETAKQDAKIYMDTNPEQFNVVYKNRKKLYEGYWRCESLTK